MSQDYEAPRLTVIGSVSEVTAMNQDGDFTDDAFPANTPRGDLTFS